MSSGAITLEEIVEDPRLVGLISAVRTTVHEFTQRPGAPHQGMLMPQRAWKALLFVALGEAARHHVTYAAVTLMAYRAFRDHEEPHDKRR